jgi:hypothetical protein
MRITTQRELESTRAKLDALESRCRDNQVKPERTHLDDLSLRSLRKLAKQLREEITLAEIHGVAASSSAPPDVGSPFPNAMEPHR